jgi:hypothetical protein
MDASSSGFFIIVLLVSAALTAPTAVLLLWLYRRSVQRGMTSAPEDRTGSRVGDSPTLTAVRTTPLSALRILDFNTAPGADDNGYFRDAEQSLRRVVLVYALAGLALALVFSLGWSLQLVERFHAWRRILWMASCFWWPTVLAIELVAATSRRERLSIVAVYLTLLAAFSWYVLARNPASSPGQMVTFWVIANLPPTVLMGAFLRRRVRAVGPIVLTFMLIAVLGSQLAVSLLRNERWMRGAIVAATALHLPDTGILVALMVAGFFLFGFVGWWLLRRFSERYRRKRTSDQSLMLDALFLYFVLDQSIALDPTLSLYLLVGPVAFLAYKATTWVGFRYLRRRQKAANPAPPVLLLLRAFSLGGRSERLFDALTKRWRRVGCIALIAGPDLVRTTVEPHEFLDFVGGKMSRRFVTGQADLANRMSSFDREPDPDGRYRVNQFFCRPDTWQMTLRRLVQESSVVLMDLRGFSPRNQGCVYELGQLLSSADLRRVVFVVDATTDRQFLDDTLQRSWQQVPADSPNCAVAEPGVRLFFARDDSGPEVRVLLRELLARV